MDADPLIGGELAGYRIERVVGRGGMGVVYLATDAVLERQVAVKVLSQHLSYQSTFRDRFIVESRRAAALEHPAIVPIYRAGEADGQLFIAMRYVEHDLASLLRRGPLAADVALRIGAQIADALDSAHAHGLVHRDVKPANILVEDGSHGLRAFLADFGLTKRVAEDSTRTGELVGTLDYVAPEHVEGRPIDGRSDQYSLACVLYESLVGHKPYQGDSEAAVLWGHVKGAVPRIAAQRPGTTPALDDAVARGMAKDPLERFASCGELIATAMGVELPARAEEPGEPEPMPAPVPPPQPAGDDHRTTSPAGRPRPTPVAIDPARSAALAAMARSLCDQALAALDAGPVADRVALIRRRLDDPLRVAVVGRVNAGKSTLVNALIRERLARTGAAETTNVVTWFEYGFPEQITVLARDGRTWDLPLGTEARLPSDLGAGAAQVEKVTMRLSIDALRSLTIIDTPGLASATAELSDATRALLAIDAASREAVALADAVLYVLAHPIGGDDLDTLATLRRRGGGPRVSALNMLAALSKADLIGNADGVDAASIADALTDQLRSSVALVVPVIGLLAETVETGHLTESDAAALRSLAGLEARTRERMLLSGDRFRAGATAISPAVRERLLSMLDLFGIRVCLEAVDAGIADAGGLAARLREVSGVETVHAVIDAVLTTRADAIKADRALLDLERLTYEHEARRDTVMQGLRSDLEAARLQPEMHLLDELRALRDVGEPDAAVPDELDEALRRLLAGGSQAARLDADGDVAELRAAAQRGASRWRAWANGDAPTGIAARVADTVARSYEIIWAQLREGEGAES